MSYPIQVPKRIENVLTTATSEQLQDAQSSLVAKYEAGRIELEAAAQGCALIDYELQLRQIEPLWRKAHRFAKRNKEGLGIAAAVLGVVVGVEVST